VKNEGKREKHLWNTPMVVKEKEKNIYGIHQYT
jgi:hypothetical protein